jgi:hypothetical protein
MSLTLVAFVALCVACGDQGTERQAKASSRPRAVAFEISWPHGTTVGTQPLTVPGRVLDVYLSDVRLTRSAWTCLQTAMGESASSARARYRVTSAGVTVTLDDDPSQACSTVGYKVDLVGGYGSAGVMSASGHRVLSCTSISYIKESRAACRLGAPAIQHRYPVTQIIALEDVSTRR